MPELPEVEMYRRFVERNALGKLIDRVDLSDRRILHRTTAAALIRHLRGRALTTTHRHGKHLFARADDGPWLYLHFGMTGDVHLASPGAPLPRFSRLALHFSNGEAFAFEDMRLFGRAGIVTDPLVFIKETGLGPDPLDRSFAASDFLALLDRKRGAIKSVLMNQRNIAGLGNLWVDETLYQCGVRPKRPVERIARVKRREIFSVMRRILNGAIERQERGLAYPETWLIESRREEGTCPKCGGSIRRTVVFGRTTYFCARHQL